MHDLLVASSLELGDNIRDDLMSIQKSVKKAQRHKMRTQFAHKSRG